MGEGAALSALGIKDLRFNDGRAGVSGARRYNMNEGTIIFAMTRRMVLARPSYGRGTG